MLLDYSGNILLTLKKYKENMFLLYKVKITYIIWQNRNILMVSIYCLCHSRPVSLGVAVFVVYVVFFWKRNNS